MAIEPPGSEAGTWAGAPSAVRDGDQILLAYRLRRPIGHGRGYAVAIARSADGVHFETIQVITRDEMDTESLERPALVRTPSGAWRLYLSCATWGTKHWRVELLEAPAPDAFDARKRAVVLPGDTMTAVEVPVIQQDSNDLVMITGASFLIFLLVLVRGSTVRNRRSTGAERLGQLRLVAGFTVAALLPLILMAESAIRLSERVVTQDAQARVSTTSAVGGPAGPGADGGPGAIGGRLRRAPAPGRCAGSSAGSGAAGRP